jgi:hypothetical protein
VVIFIEFKITTWQPCKICISMFTAALIEWITNHRSWFIFQGILWGILHQVVVLLLHFNFLQRNLKNIPWWTCVSVALLNCSFFFPCWLMHMCVIDLWGFRTLHIYIKIQNYFPLLANSKFSLTKVLIHCWNCIMPCLKTKLIFKI